jgi:transcriptional regulator with XRE-family HTH domain
MKLTERAMVRRRAGLTQHQLAKRTGVHVPRISLWENGEIDLSEEEISRIAKAIARELELRPVAITPRDLTQILNPTSSLM